MIQLFGLACGVVAFLSVEASAIAPAPPAMMPSAPAAASNFQQGNQYYDGSVSGLSDYMVDLKGQDSRVHAELAADLESIQSKRMWSYIAPAVLAIGGIGLEIAGAGNGSIPAMATGSLMLLASVPAYWLLAPGRSDYLNFINKHNRLRPGSPLKLNMGMLPGTGAVYFARLAFTF